MSLGDVCRYLYSRTGEGDLGKNKLHPELPFYASVRGPARLMDARMGATDSSQCTASLPHSSATIVTARKELM